MKTYARIQGGVVVELFSTDGDITQMFHPDLVWVEAQADTAPGDLYEGGSFTRPAVPEATLDDLKIAKLATINADFTGAASALTEGYPPAERLTWPVQQQEAMAWAADSNAPTPYLDGLALARGITPDEMRQKTVEQTQLFMAASQQLVGTRQRLRDLVHDAETPEDLDNINWPEAEPQP